ncbi:hypothetical protein GCM10029992_59890 [Glycomyces albus]
MPAVSSANRYGSRKAPPPNSYASPGKRQMFPRPIADPAAARMNPARVPQVSLCVIMSGFLGFSGWRGAGAGSGCRPPISFYSSSGCSGWVMRVIAETMSPPKMMTMAMIIMVTAAALI